MLSFIFLADGPCSESSWRVNDDKGQWWSRRDALVRIVSASIWQAAGVRSDVAGDSCFLFGQQGGNGSEETTIDKFCRPVIVHSSQALSDIMPVPTERNLIKVWKESCGAAERANAEIGIGRWPLSRSNGVLCSFHPWKEMLLSSGAGTTSTGQSSLAGGFDHSKLDKRELLKLLQQSCPVEFLRQHGLNGSEALVLKKKNRDAISTAYEAWLTQSANQSHSGMEVKIPASSDCTTKSACYEKLLNTCKVLLKGILCRFYKTNDLSKIGKEGATIGTLLLLHEDYPHELPVFSETHTSK